MGDIFFSNLFGLLRIYEHLDNTWRQTRGNWFCRLVTRRYNFNEVSSMLTTSSCIVKSIPWNIVNLYLLFSLMITLDFNCIPRDPFFKSGGTDPDVSRIKLLIKGGIFSEGIFNFVLSVQTHFSIFSCLTFALHGYMCKEVQEYLIVQIPLIVNLWGKRFKLHN